LTGLSEEKRSPGGIASTTLITNIQGYSIHDGPGIRTIVFTKGCGLACRWCCNPECISPLPEVGFNQTLCTSCGKCAGICKHGALSFLSGGHPELDRRQCTGCGECISVCDYKALVLHGKPMSVQEVFEAVSRDNLFYQSSGGGVTVSGGESLLHPEFVRGLLEKCRTANINTCIETSGYADSEVFKLVLPLLDYVLYDLKHLDSVIHHQYTGKPNELILKNAGIIVGSGVQFLFRMPLIPGVNDNLRNIQETAIFLKSLGRQAQRIELMPYHRLGESKYSMLDRKYGMRGFLPPENDYVISIKHSFEERDIECSISM
jgi:pyruvate formate lyase activating enzyme